MKHTALPWQHHRGDRPFSYNISGKTNVVRNVLKEANAEFIVRACNSHYKLLEALTAIQQAFIDGDIRFTRKRIADSDPYHPANTKMVQALAKAEGK